jgi:hypothetical protein
MNDSHGLREQLAQRSRQLQEIAAQLKTELFGIDPVIDRVIDSVRAWYVLPELVSRPVIVCHQDVWALLSDGRLPPALSLLGDIESSLAEAAYDAERADVDEAKLRFKLRSWEAKELQRNLKLDEPLMEIMGWSPEQIQERLRSFRESGQQQWETDHSRLLVFVCGNLDEMYEDVATSVDDCDSDADTFHAMTSKLSVIDVKQALNKRFKPEQVAQLGNVHVIYPSLSRRAYEQLIVQGCARYAMRRRTAAVCASSWMPACTSRSTPMRCFRPRAPGRCSRRCPPSWAPAWRRRRCGRSNRVPRLVRV